MECSLPVAGHFRYGTGHDLSHENVWAVIEKLSQFPMWKGNNRYIRHFSCHYFDVSNVRTMKNICMQKKTKSFQNVNWPLVIQEMENDPFTSMIAPAMVSPCELV